MCIDAGGIYGSRGSGRLWKWRSSRHFFREWGNRGAGSGTSGDVVELTFYNADGQEDPWTDPVAQALTEATGVKLKTDYPVSADDEKVALMIAEQNYPDMIYAKGMQEH